jgi:DNA polymerase (family X)
MRTIPYGSPHRILRPVPRHSATRPCRRSVRLTAPDYPALLRQLGDFAEIRGASLDATAWRRFAADLEHLGPPGIARFADLAKRNRLAEFNIPPSLHSTLRDLVFEGPEITITARWAAMPWLLRRLIEFGTVNSAGAAALARGGIVTLPDLDAALEDGRVVRDLSPLEEGLRLAVATLASERPRLTLGRAVDLAENFVLLAAAACPEIEALVPAGDVRRFEPLVNVIVVVGAAPDPQTTLERICAIPMLQGAAFQTGRRALVRSQQTEIDVRIAARDEYGSALHIATGSAPHVAAVRARHGAPRLGAREEDVYSQSGLAFVPPELRHNTGEIEAAAAHALPQLVRRDDIRGDLHMHTTYSDGRDSLAAMVQAAAALGYEYIAITDHSERAGAPRTVTHDALARQRDDIARMRERFPAIAILHGIEVDIMPDGRLDFDDAVLEPLDIVLASLHDSAGHDPARLTRRCLAAIRHPLVTVITHPANRLVGRDPGYELDFAAVYAAAAETGTALEIDGAPSHLDMDGERARGAIAAGVTVTIDSDCHKATLLDRQMRLGVGTARRGWVEARHVLNTRPVADVRAFVAAKRQFRG